MKDLAILLATTVLALCQQPSPSVRAVEYPAPLIREQQEVTVNGRQEIWQLQWAAAPEPFCSPSELSLSCPCMGFAYGETGDLSLARLRDGAEIDRLHFTPLSSVEGEKVALQRWPVDDQDFRDPEIHDLPNRITHRPVVQAMQFADYDHTGESTEFYLQTGTEPCGKSMGIVVGVSQDRPKLHAVTTASHPERPLVLFKHEWEALHDARSSPVDALESPCGDHGAEFETRVLMSWGKKGLLVSRREYTCPVPGAAKRLIRSEKL